MPNIELSHSDITRPTRRESPETTAGSVLLGFLPAFLDLDTREVHLSVDENGKLAAVHLLDNLPDHWVIERDSAGRITALKENIIAGFMRQDRFFTRAELVRMPWDA